MKSIILKRLTQAAASAACAFAVAFAGTAQAQPPVTSIDFEDVVFPDEDTFVNMTASNTAFTPGITTGNSGVNVGDNAAQVLYDAGNFFGQGTDNKILFTKDGNGSVANGGSGTEGTPTMATPAVISGGGGFQLSFDFYHPTPTWTIAGGANGQRIALTDLFTNSQGNNTNGERQSVALRLSQVTNSSTHGRFYALLEGAGLDAAAGYPTVNYTLNEKHNVTVVGNYNKEENFEYTVGAESFSVIPQHYHVWLDDVRLWSSEFLEHGGNVPFRYNADTAIVRDFTSAARLIIAGSSASAVSSTYFDNIQVWDFGAMPGDYNKDGVVNAADYVVWRDTMSDQPAKYEEWKANFGTGSEGSGAVAGHQAAVPEPSVLLLLATALAAVACIARRR